MDDEIGGDDFIRGMKASKLKPDTPAKELPSRAARYAAGEAVRKSNSAKGRDNLMIGDAARTVERVARNVTGIHREIRKK